MNFRDLIGLCVKNLLRRRTRTILAVVGVIIGTCAIVVMLSVGFGMTESFNAQIESYSGIHMIRLYNWGSSYNDAGEEVVISDRSIAKIEKMDGVEGVTPVVDTYMTVGAGKYKTSVQIIGVKPEVLEKFNYKVKEGRMLKDSDKDAMLFGSWVPQWFYNPQSKVYQSVDVNVVTNKLVLTQDWYYLEKENERPKDAIDYKVYDMTGVGLLEETNDNSDYCVYMNISRVEEIIKDTQKAEGYHTWQNPATQSKEKTYEQAIVYVPDLNYVEKVNDELKEQGYQTSSPLNWLSAMKDTANMIQMILGGIGGISLLVAALSITNTMVMSIYERTKEIGVMKVIGANLKDIRRMFLVEAGMIGFIGGVIGALISLLLSFLMNTVLYDVISMALMQIGGGYSTVISVIPFWLVLAAVAFSTLIGVVAGYSPARRAMKLSALESLRNE